MSTDNKAATTQLVEDLAEGYRLAASTDVRYRKKSIPCYLVYQPDSSLPFWVCSKRAQAPEEAKAWLKAKLRYEYIEHPKRFQGPPQVSAQEDWGHVLTWLKVNVLPNPRGIVYED